jgi:hypothetical protein
VAETLWADATTNQELAFTMRGVEKGGTARVERGAGRSTIVWGNNWNDKKKREEMGLLP